MISPRRIAAKADGPMRQRSDTQFGQLLMLPEMRFAHAAISRLSGPAAPLITICGPPGSGKSHLTRNIIREILRQEPELKFDQLTATEFAAEVGRAVKARTISEFQESYRSLALFVCEDLQSLEGRNQVQYQLLSIVDEILSHSGRVLLTTAKSPGSIASLLPKLRSRCLGGICATIEPCSTTSRQLLLLHFAEERGLTLHPEIAEQIAGALTLSPRELRGVIVRLEQLSRQHRRPVDRAIADAVIHQSCVPDKPSLGQITKVVAKAFSVTAGDLRSQCRLQGLVLPRQLAMFAAREWSGQAYSEISRHFNRRSHSTIVHACQRIRKLLQTDADFSRTVEGIREQLNLATAGHFPSSTTC